MPRRNEAKQVLPVIRHLPIRRHSFVSALRTVFATIRQLIDRKSLAPEMVARLERLFMVAGTSTALCGIRDKDKIMLRISTNHVAGSLTFRLEGKLAGPWVKEFEDCWQNTQAARGAVIHVDLKAVTFIDGSGKELLAAMHSQGVTFACGGCLVNAIVSEITRSES